MTQDTQPGELRVSRMIDMKLPLPWLLSVAGALALALGGIFFKVGQLQEDTAELKIAVKAGNSSTTTVQGELAILRFRVETLEAERRAAAAHTGSNGNGVPR